MKRRVVCVALLMAGFEFASAESPFVVGGFDLSRDTDSFRSEIYSAGGGVYFSADNTIDRIGYRRSESHYSSPGFAAHGSADSLFAGKALGSVEGAQGEVSGELTHARLDNGEQHWLGWAQLSGKPTARTTAELRYEQNWIDSRNGIDAGVTYAALTAAADVDLFERLNLAGVVGRLDFSDGNHRPLYRAKANWLLSETYGVSMYMRGRKYTDSDPYTGNYFSPESYKEYLAGFGVRRRIPLVRGTLSGSIDWGRQDADGVTSPARTWQLRLESWRGQFGYALRTGMNATGGVGGGTDYEYRYTSGSVTWRF